MTALRTMEGVNMDQLLAKFGNHVSTHVEIAARKYIKDGKIQVTKEKLMLTKAGKLFADGIAADLFV